MPNPSMPNPPTPNSQPTVAKQATSNTDTPLDTIATSDENVTKDTLPKAEKTTPTKQPTTLTKPQEKLKQKSPKKAIPAPQTPIEFMANEYKGVSIYAMTMAILIGLILWTGIATVQQVQAYHQQYGVLQQLKKDYRNLQIENQRLLIEQQTFSATPQIASRAVSELNMFYPQLSDRMIIQANNLTPSQTSNPATGNAQATDSNIAASTHTNTATVTNTPTIPVAAAASPPAQIENGHVTPLHPAVEDPDARHLATTPQANQGTSQANSQGAGRGENP